MAGLHDPALGHPHLWRPGTAPPAGYEPDPDALMEVMFTSGTTGRPKGVMNSANTKLAGLRGFLAAVPAGRDDVWGLMAPMAHQAGWAYTFLLALYTGATTVIVGRGDPERMLDTLAAEGVTITFAVPTHALDLLKAWRARPGAWDLKLRYVLTGTTGGPPGLYSAEQALAGCAGVESIAVCGIPEERLGELICACVVGAATTGQRGAW